MAKGDSKRVEGTAIKYPSFYKPFNLAQVKSEVEIRLNISQSGFVSEHFMSSNKPQQHIDAMKPRIILIFASASPLHLMQARY